MTDLTSGIGPQASAARTRSRRSSKAPSVSLPGSASSTRQSVSLRTLYVHFAERDLPSGRNLTRYLKTSSPLTHSCCPIPSCLLTDPGLTKVNPFSEHLATVDVKIQVVELPLQSILTKDNLQAQIESVIVWQVTNPYRAAFGVSDVRRALIERAQTTLRDVVGSRNLQSVLTEREAVAAEIEEIVEHVSEKWGVRVS